MTGYGLVAVASRGNGSRIGGVIDERDSALANHSITEFPRALHLELLALNERGRAGGESCFELGQQGIIGFVKLDNRRLARPAVGQGEAKVIRGFIGV